MDLQVIAKNNVELSEAVRTYTEKKIGKLARYLPTIGEGKVEISHESAKLPQQRFTVQVTLDSKGVLIRAHERSDDIRTAVDRVVEVLTKRIERYKGKLYDKGRGVSLARQGATIEAEDIEAPKRVVKGKHFLVCLLYTSPSPRDRQKSRMPSSA